MRKARQKSETGFYHSIIQGVNKQNIFYDDDDRYFFLSLVSKYSIKYDIQIHSYVLLDNHAHLLLHEKQTNPRLSQFMQNITSVYAKNFNKKYDRIGHLFNDRFMSKPIEDTEYLQECFSYIMQNPEKAGIAKMENYKWSSYKAYKSKNTFVTTKFLIESFDGIDNLYKFLHKKVDGIFLEPRKRYSEIKNDLLQRFLNILGSSNPIIPPESSKDDIRLKILKLKTAGFSSNYISRISGLPYSLVAKCTPIFASE